MNQLLEKIKSDLNDSLYELSRWEIGSDRLIQALKITDEAQMALNNLSESLQFTDETEEIHFFKQFKPELLACRIEEVMKYHIHRNVPIGTDESRLKYYEDELKARTSFFRMNSFHYQYFKSGLSDLDRIYFLSGARPLSVLVADLPESDNEFSTPMTFLFAKFIAYEHIQCHILEQIARIAHPELQQSKSNNQTFELSWTGDSVNMVELAYGIWLTGQLNNGNASLNQIVRWLESTLHISIGIIQRRFNEIERRKRLSVTKFIDQMKDAILKKIESGNS
ncbi:RteC domain-containing protein [Mucilaginibacter angelicae]|uniref:RteC domain-containing protein n=1 Tax=Mucilaginibacter angelicae TaxID=869718 RepID=A0ABV6L098_9SPHI